jgi:hypothetical protein
VTTALQIIERAYRTIGVLASGETATAEMAQDALVYLNDVLSGLSNESLIIYADTLDSVAMDGSASYTYGAGGDINSVRPTKINNIFFRDVNNVDYDVQMITSDQYDSIALKSTSTGIPTCVYVSADYPLATVYPWPLASAGTMYFMSNKPLTAFAGLMTAVALPTGYDRLLRYCLAAEMMPEYGIVNQQVLAMMMDAKAKIKRTNSRSSVLTVMLPYGNNDGSGMRILTDGL